MINWIAIIFVLFGLGFTAFLFLSTWFDIWFLCVNLVIIGSLGGTAVAFILRYQCGEDTREKRKRVAVAHMLLLIMWFVVSIWSIIYINEFYHHEYVFYGIGEPEEDEDGKIEAGFLTWNKKIFVLACFCWGILLATIHFWTWYVA